jgi:hypothetical protein
VEVTQLRGSSGCHPSRSRGPAKKLNPTVGLITLVHCDQYQYVRSATKLSPNFYFGFVKSILKVMLGQK